MFIITDRFSTHGQVQHALLAVAQEPEQAHPGQVAHELEQVRGHLEGLRGGHMVKVLLHGGMMVMGKILFFHADSPLFTGF